MQHSHSTIKKDQAHFSSETQAILIIEDDRKIASLLADGLKQAGYDTEIASDGETGFTRICSGDFAAAIVDIMLPRLDGLTLIESVRNNDIDIPMLILSAKRQVIDRVKGLDSGADDYLVKPFSFTELLARLRAMLRRTSNVSVNRMLEFGELSIDTQRRQVFFQDQSLNLQPREIALLEYLIRNQGETVSRAMLIDNVWDVNFIPDANVVEACISRLRGKLRKKTGKKFIKTIRGLGYTIEPE